MKKIFNWYKNTLLHKKTPNELNEDEKKAYQDIEGLTKNPSWDVLNVELYDHLKTAKDNSNWRVFSSLDKIRYAAQALIVFITILSTTLFFAGTLILYVLFSSFVIPSISIGLPHLDSIFKFIIKSLSIILATLSPIYFAAFSFFKLKNLASSSISKRQTLIFNNENTWSGIDDEIKNSFSKSLPLPLQESWWEKAIDILKEYGKVDKNDEKPKESTKDEFILKIKQTVSQDQHSKA